MDHDVVGLGSLENSDVGAAASESRALALNSNTPSSASPAEVQVLLRVTCSVSTLAQTGVEMEAMTGKRYAVAEGCRYQY